MPKHRFFLLFLQFILQKNMTHSMTGYGKAELSTKSEKFTVEIRSLNGKNCDISLKTSMIPRDKDLKVRQTIIGALTRGNIDLYISVEHTEQEPLKQINKEVMLSYYKQICELQSTTEIVGSGDHDMLSSLLRLPDVIESRKTEITEESWETLYSCIELALENINDFRQKEGKVLHDDILMRVHLIESYISNVEEYEQERILTIKDRLKSKIADLSIKPDENRMEQEIIYYMEKLDINEEKVRLRQHCKYFQETLEGEIAPGKKLGFIAQEMGREINTLGSKANHAEIQKWVVQMKNELEKIKEQSLNIL